MKLIWIGGTGRSGTTLLRNVLALHPDVYVIPHESTPYPEDPSAWSTWCRNVYREHRDEAERLGKKHLVEKTPRNCLVWPELRARTAEMTRVDGCTCVYAMRDTMETVRSLRRYGHLTHPPWTRIDDTVTDQWLVDWVERIDAIGAPGADVVVTLAGMIDDPYTTIHSIGLEPTQKQIEYPYDRTKR